LANGFLTEINQRRYCSALFDIDDYNQPLFCLLQVLLMSSRFELLAPGGDLEAIHAAIAAGSDAIYLGLDRFNARNRAKNISLAELKAVCYLAHQQQCKIFVTLNVMLLESELPALLRLLNRLIKLNVDGLIAQDLGLLYLLHQHFPDVEVHASTQLNTHNEGQIDALKSLGVNRVNLARELNLEEITALTRHAAMQQMKIEVFVHGSYCVGFSGLCYISSTRNGCSGNRGRCSQPCRDQYQTTEQGSAFPLNLKDNSAFAELDALAAAGVYSLKIEGRIKSSHYVFSVVSQWREQLDRYQQGQPLVKDLSNLYKVFNRDFTANYLSGEIGKAMFIDNPRNNALSHFVEQRQLTQPEQINNLKQELYQHNSELMQQMRKQIAAMQASANALPSDLQANQAKAVEVQLPQYRMEDDPNTSPNLAVLINQTHDIALSQQAKLEVFWALPNALSNKLDEQLAIFKQYPDLNPWFPAVLIDKDFAAAEQFLAQQRPKLLVTNNLGVAELAKQMGLAWVAGPQMNTANSLAIACIQQHYKGQGAFLSNELNAKQLQRLVIPKGFRSFYSIFHPNQLLSSRQCLFQQSSGCKKQRLNKSCLSRCSKSTRILNLKDAQYIIDKQAGEYNHLFSQQHVLNTQAITEMAHKFSDVLVDLRNIATDTTWSGVSNAELVTFFQDLIRQEDDAEACLQALLTPSINQQYLKGL